MIKNLFQGTLDRKQFLIKMLLSVGVFCVVTIILMFISHNDTPLASGFMPAFLFSFLLTCIYQFSFTGGWIISRNNIAKFFDDKLTEVGLTAKERQDMKEYWIPVMLSHSNPFFRISFLTTAQMNEIVPMAISPRPDSVYRIFLDYLPLDSSNDMKQIPPQTLPHVVRQGFTLVEWGGLKR